MAKAWPAIDVRGDANLVLAAADDFSPTAAEEVDDVLRIFFQTPDARNRAAAAMRSMFAVTSIDVDDQDWARKQDLAPIAIGNIIVFPEPRATRKESRIAIIIPASMGFGTGHHATTRLCLAALQGIDVRGKFVLDVGTGSGLLAIAAAKLGAARAVGIDDDADAIQAANENLELNHVTNVEFVVADLMKDELPSADVVFANLTGALVVRAADRLVKAIRAGGVLIISGVLAAEGDDIRRAFANQTIVDVVQEDEWLGLTIRR